MIYLNRGCKCKYKKRKCNGRKVILSAILFENGVAALLFVESRLIDKLIRRNENPWKLIRLNTQIAKMICCLKNFEEKIVLEIIKE